MNSCNGKCTQGRDCSCFKEVNLFWDVMEGMVTLCALVGVIAVMCFAFGFYWYAP
jgi:hypothetical protein